jgi:hypothetical protein
MTIAKIRNLSKYGVVTDVDPYNLPAEAWSMAVNARFKNGAVERAPVFKRVPLTLSNSDPRYLASNFPSAGFDSVIIGYLNGRVTSYVTGTESDVSVVAYVPNNSEEPYTSCHLGDVLYINRPDRVPWALRVSDTQFQTLANWNANWRAKILRSCNSVLCAFGITKSGTTFPTMVKTSQAALVNAVPASWDEADPTKNAYENILSEMEGPITEAQKLGQEMFVYGTKETWVMTPMPSTEIWDVRPRFSDAGCINVNCAVEVDKKHYVFGRDDIWAHDGVSKQSICDARTRTNIFDTINIQKSSRFFVKYDERRKELRFNYVSGDRLTNFIGGDGCNRSAVYYIPEGTWTFDDLPFVFGAASANLSNSPTYLTVTGDYQHFGGTYLNLEDGLKRFLIMLGDVNTGYGLSRSLYALDDAGPASLVGFTTDLNATKGVILERDGIDLDELEEVETLEGYKVTSSIYPQARLEIGAQPLMLSVGAALNYNDIPTFMPPQSYDGVVDTRCDFNISGRWLFLKITHDDYHWFKLTGLDLDIYESGER